MKLKEEIRKYEKYITILLGHMIYDINYTAERLEMNSSMIYSNLM
ncbi:MAG: hypothetical protein ACFFCY_14030 [Promethearchaeota archaeon]